MNVTVSTLFITLASFSFVSLAEAAPISKPVRQACQNDYRKFCGEYGIDSPALRHCMDRAGKNLSKVCVNALINAGEVTRTEVNRRK